MGSPCLNDEDGPYEKMIEAIQFSEENRRVGDDIMAVHREPIARALRRHHRESDMAPPSEREIAVAAELRALKDTGFSLSVQNERWGWRLALMYAHAQLVEVQSLQLVEQQRTNELLERLLVQLGNASAHRTLPPHGGGPPTVIY